MKLGGSAITNKSEFETLKSEQLTKAARVVKTCVDSGLKCVVVHGAGSFGHHQAKEYKVNKGWAQESTDTGKMRLKEGFAKTRLSVLKLNGFVNEALIIAGVRAIAVPAFGLWHDEHKDLAATRFVAHVQQCIENDLVPVCHGDAIFDANQGCRILSGDIIIKQLCDGLCVSRAVFLSDVEGIYTKPPSEEGATLIPEVYAKENGTADVRISTSTLRCDTTGGISLKLNSACEIAWKSRGDTTVFICGVDSEGALNACRFGDLKGELGTKISCGEVSEQN